MLYYRHNVKSQRLDKADNDENPLISTSLLLCSKIFNSLKFSYLDIKVVNEAILAIQLLFLQILS